MSAKNTSTAIKQVRKDCMKEWYTVDELLELRSAELPQERSGYSRRASKDNWKRRKRDTGKRGITYEYHISSLPKEVQRLLGCPESTIEALAQSESAGKGFLNANRNDSIDRIVAIVSSLKPNECEDLSMMLGRKGADFLTKLLDEDTVCLMQLTGEKKEAALLLTQLDLIRVREILSELRASRDMGRTASQQAVGDHKKDLV
ncbi:hypothetical protein MPT26_001719 [Salmonella enterica]|uniref:HTH Mu-type domain-containing protein n=1 Tax=Salmonella enterica subsp. enterica serovar Pensacola TaxID=34042 RepID=A0A602Z0N1_SALET|nr:hypothetical protein [Salmonella enterica]ECT8495274.1 hypothetical protein [Salmonella enterica subsp. enterica serovar Pensacola]EAV2404816.1 hypothetical protein [Salmonella enterica]EBO9448637.1 hypothetical protein [Salmonella enterica]EBT4616288.1 hypothetical protein [Salmonella enterica]